MVAGAPNGQCSCASIGMRYVEVVDWIGFSYMAVGTRIFNFLILGYQGFGFRKIDGNEL